MYRASGRHGEAIALLETIIHIVEQDLDLRNAIIWQFYNEMLVDLALCYAEEGHRDEARYVLNKQLKVPPNFEETIANMHRNRFFREFFVTLKLCWGKSREKALRVVGGLENGRADTQEHHTRLQEGSCQQGISEWGPFLTDCIEWDKI